MPTPAFAAAQRILIIKPSSLGDVVHALPVLAGLRNAYPQAHIAWLIGNSFAPLLEKHPLLDEVIRFDRRRFGRMLQSPRIFAEFLGFVRQLRRRRFDLVLDLQGLFRSGFLAYASGARRRVGFADTREFAWLFYSQRIAPSQTTGSAATQDVHAVDKNLSLARALGLPVDPPIFPLGLGPDELAAARQLLVTAAGRALDRFTAVIPGARWETKRWRAERLAELIDRLAADDLPPAVLLGSPDDRAFADKILALRQTSVIDLVGHTSLRQLSALLSLADLVVCHDSGPMHIAAALGKPLVAIFGPTNPVRTGPYGQTCRVVALPVPCAPCYKRRCPLGHHNCMQQLDVEMVLRNVRELRATACTAAAR